MVTHSYIRTFTTLDELKSAINDKSINFWTLNAYVAENPMYDVQIVHEKQTNTIFFGKYGMFENSGAKVGNNTVPVNYRIAQVTDLGGYEKMTSQQFTELKRTKVAAIVNPKITGTNNWSGKFNPAQFKQKLTYAFSAF